MRTRKRALLGFDEDDIFVYSLSSMAKNKAAGIRIQVPRNVRIVRVAGSVHMLPMEAFKDCEELEEVILDRGVKVIGGSAFSGCLALSKVRFPSTLQTIQSFAFYNCCSLSSIELPMGIQAVGIGAFELCTSLKYLDLSYHSRCTMIDKCAFQGCSQLAVAHLPPNLKGLILMEVFCDCTALTHIRFPQGVTDISPSAVEGCTSLVSLEVPEGLWRFDVVPNVTGGSDGIQSCPSLVNLYTPSEQWIVSRVDGMSFPSDFTLGRLAVGWRDLVFKLQGRFKDRPLHKICYFQSYHAVLDTIQEMKGILASNPMAHEQVDTLGMTPLHILMLAETPVMELFQELPKQSLKTMVDSKDLFGSTPLDYRCKNAAGREAIRIWLPQILEERLPHLGLDRWKKEVLLEEEQGIATWEDHIVVSQRVGSVLRKLLQCEFREVLSIVELVLWKTKLTQNHKDGSEGESVWRQKCRVQCGIAIVVENTVPFLCEAGGTSCQQQEARSNLTSFE